MAAAAAALLLGCLLCGAGGQRVKVREEVVALVGEEAVLPCLLGAAGPGVRVSQVTWVRSGGGGGRRSVAVLHPRLAPSYPGEGGGRLRFRGRSLLDATLLLGPLRLADRGVYTCEFATYPDGTEGASTRLLVLAKPRSQAAALAVAPGSLPVPVATCTAAGGHPAANVTWESPVGGSAEAEAEPAGPDGAVTVTSRFSLVPSPAADKQRVVCVVRHPGLPRPQRLPVALSVLASTPPRPTSRPLPARSRRSRHGPPSPSCCPCGRPERRRRLPRPEGPRRPGEEGPRRPGGRHRRGTASGRSRVTVTVTVTTGTVTTTRSSWSPCTGRWPTRPAPSSCRRRCTCERLPPPPPQFGPSSAPGRPQFGPGSVPVRSQFIPRSIPV
ncbi:nectin-2 isoform X2 [Struthio camelus]|uniref:nectin-2 isoform X2 n=1 Tax=Struthio camelus TaxID=8801 RepID=UPI003603B12B